MNCDIHYGNEMEEKILPIIREHFNDSTIIRTANKYCKYDFEGKDSVYELKSRRNSSTQYSTTMIGKNKVLDIEKIQIFLFHFTDGLFYVKYDKNLFATFEEKQMGRYDRGRPEEQLYLLIPVDRLFRISN